MALVRFLVTIAAGVAIVVVIGRYLGWDVVGAIALGALATVVRDRWVWR